MTDLHISDFYRDVGKIFQILYASFPRKIILYVEDVAGPDQPDEFGLHCPRFEAGFSTMLWLAEHNYLSYETTIRQQALDQAVLSQRGFLLLSSLTEPEALVHPKNPAPTPSLSKHHHSHIAQLRHALKDGSSIVVHNFVNYLLSRP